MSNSLLSPLISQMREALASDGEFRPEAVLVPQLIAQIRTAIETDRVFVAADDLKLAEAVREFIPRITRKATEMHEQLREGLLKDAPWALVPLDSVLDLLSPLGKAMHEPTHTRVLGFLLDPSQPHGLGTRALREFFSMMGRLIPGEDTFGRLARDVSQGTETLRRFRVTAEQAHQLPGRGARCDLWLELDDTDRSLIVVIENKVEAGEHGDQLKSYEDALWQRAKARRYLNFEARLIFLTPDGHLPDQDYDRRLWLPVSYTNLAACLAHASRDAPEPGRTYLNLYNSTLLRCVLGIPSQASGIERLRQLSFLSELRHQGVTS
jgi:hypothetical protein